MINRSAIRESFQAAIERPYKSIWSKRYGHSSDENEPNDDRAAKFQAILESDDEFYVLYRCSNLAATWLSTLAASLVEEISALTDEQEPLDEQAVALAFFSRLANDLWAIIELCELGFDLQARALAKSYLEHVDVLICCIHDVDFTRDFTRSADPDLANQFWHKKVSKNKAKKRVSQFIASHLGYPDRDLVELLREDADTLGSLLVHPTMFGGLSTAFGHPDGDYESYPIFPTPLPVSSGTFRTVLIHLFWLKIAMGPLPRQRFGAWRALTRFETSQGRSSIVALELVYLRMFDFLLDH